MDSLAVFLPTLKTDKHTEHMLPSHARRPVPDTLHGRSSQGSSTQELRTTTFLS